MEPLLYVHVNLQAEQDHIHHDANNKGSYPRNFVLQYAREHGHGSLGCSSGPNALLVISEIIDIIYAECRHLDRMTPELRMYLNDLPSNDFNNIFESLPEFYEKVKDKRSSELGPCFISAVPGTFYGRLFPSKSLHFVHSSSSLHWLSQVPSVIDCKATQTLNKGKLYISETSPPCVLAAYALQFQKDFSLFLKSRSEEIVAGGGRMVLSFMGRRSADPASEECCFHWELFALALMSMVSEGLIEEEMVDSFNAPYYAPCPEELKIEVEKEGSFMVNRLEAFEIDWDGMSQEEYDPCEPVLARGQRVANTIRAVLESMLECHFGNYIMDDLFQRFGQLVGQHLSKTRAKYINLVISLVRKA